MLNVQVLGASYGLLLSAKILLAGHNVRLICTQAECETIDTEGFRVRLPIAGKKACVELFSGDLPGRLETATPTRARLQDADLVVFAMQEPQYRAPELRKLLSSIAAARVPCLSIMNMPPLPFLQRFSGIDQQACRPAYTDASVWSDFDPVLVSHCSADPQAVRPASGAVNELEARLATNFRAAPFDGEAQTQMLCELAASIENAQLKRSGQDGALPVKLKVYPSLYTGLTKLPMLVTGNYRCFTEGGIRSIKDAVHQDIGRSRSVYESVCEVLQGIGCPAETLIPFDKYAAAANSLIEPSSAAKAVNRGVTAIERVDLLVQCMASQQGTRISSLDEVTARVDARLADNRAASDA